MDYYFSGTYEHQLDAKRRIRIPAKMKSKLGEGYSIGVGTDHCLWIMPAETTQAVQSSMAATDMADPRARAAKRKMLEGICFPEEDPQGRIVLPQNLIRYAGIEKNLLFIGQGDYIELWSAEKYEEYTASFENIDLGEFIKF